MWEPTSPSSPGISVRAAATATATTTAVEKPRLATKGMPERARPQMAMTTVVPANNTD